MIVGPNDNRVAAALAWLKLLADACRRRPGTVPFPVS